MPAPGAIAPHPLVGQLRRPRILVSAVRFALPDYRRNRLLRRLTPGETAPERVLPRLIETEARIEETRLAGDSAYNIADHIEVLVALVAESRLLAMPEQAG